MNIQEILAAISDSKQRVLAVRKELDTPSNSGNIPDIDNQKVLEDITRVNTMRPLADYTLGHNTREPALIKNEHYKQIVYLSTLVNETIAGSPGYRVPIKSLVVVDINLSDLGSSFLNLFIDHVGDLGETAVNGFDLSETTNYEYILDVVYDKKIFKNADNLLTGEKPGIMLNLYRHAAPGNTADPYYASSTSPDLDLAVKFVATKGIKYGQYNASVTSWEMSTYDLDLPPELRADLFLPREGFPHNSPNGMITDIRSAGNNHVVQKNISLYPGEILDVPVCFPSLFTLPNTFISEYPAVLLGRDKVMFDKKYKSTTGVNFKELKEIASQEIPIYVNSGSCLFVNQTSLVYKDIMGTVLLEINNPMGLTADVHVSEAHSGNTLVYYKDASGSTIVHLCDLNKDSGRVINTSLIQSDVINLDTYPLDTETVILAVTGTGVEQYVVSRAGLLVKRDLFMSGPNAIHTPDIVLFTKTAQTDKNLGLILFYTNGQLGNPVDLLYASLDISVESASFNNLITTSNNYKRMNLTDLDGMTGITKDKISINRGSKNITILISDINKEVIVKIPNSKLATAFAWSSRTITPSWGLDNPRNFTVRDVDYVVGLNGSELTLTSSDHWSFGDSNITARYPLVESFAVGFYGSDAVIVALTTSGHIKYLTLDSSFYKVAFQTFEFNLGNPTGFNHPG